MLTALRTGAIALVMWLPMVAHSCVSLRYAENVYLQRWHEARHTCPDGGAKP